jgi:hypothetical protein
MSLLMKRKGGQGGDMKDEEGSKKLWFEDSNYLLNRKESVMQRAMNARPEQ